MTCPDENTLVEYARGSLSQRGRREVDLHVDTCDACRQALAALARHLSVQTAETMLEVDTQPQFMRVLPGMVLAERFRIHEVLGSGAMGTVFEAEDLKLSEHVAVKVLAEHVAERPDALELLRREILLARRVSHPNVCPVYDMGISGPFHYITMKLVVGRTLDQLIDEGPVAPERVARLLKQLCAALAAAHEKGVVHRDLKAANVMVTGEDHVWVTDFGLARDLKGDPSYSGPVGTPAYWAPEQALGEPATPASDIYSFGVLAYRLFTGKLPRRYTHKTDFQLVPYRWRAIVQRAMAERVGERYPSGAELLTAWAATEQGRRNRTWVGVAVGVVVASVAATWVLRGMLAPPVPPVQITVPAPPVMTPEARPPEPKVEAAVAPEVREVPPVERSSPEVTAPLRDAGVARPRHKRPKAGSDMPLFE